MQAQIDTIDMTPKEKLEMEEYEQAIAEADIIFQEIKKDIKVIQVMINDIENDIDEIGPKRLDELLQQSRNRTSNKTPSGNKPGNIITKTWNKIK